MMEEEEGDAVNDDATAVPSKEPLTNADPASASPEQEHRLEFFEQRFESSPVLDSQSEERRGESDSHSRTYATVLPPDSPGKPHVQTGSTGEDSSPEAPKSKLVLDPREENKRLDLECAISAPGRRRNVTAMEEPDHTDLRVSITDREKHGARIDSHITYKICTDSMRPSHLFERTHYEVWRRYRDFEWLREQIEKTYQTLIVPPLPGKQLARYFDHMSEAFLKERQKALEKFLVRLAIHPYFSFDRDLKIFLTAEDEDFEARLSETLITGGTKLLGMVSSSVKHATTSWMLRNADPEFVKEAKYFTDLGEKLSVMERIGNRLHGEREELSESLEDFSTAVFQWSMLEPQMTKPLQRLGKCVESSNTALRSLNEANAYSLLMSVKEYQLYCAAATSAIKRRDILQLTQERMAEDREKKKKAHDEATATGKIQKIPKLAGELEKAGIAAERSLDTMTQANEQLHVDLEKWHEDTNKEMSQLMRDVADNHIGYHQKCFDEWEKMLKLLKNISTVPPVERDKHPAEPEATLLEASTDSSG